MLLIPAATKNEPRSALRPALTVRMFILMAVNDFYVSIKNQIYGASGVAGAFPAPIPVEDTSPGPVTVSKETVLLTTQAVLESLPRPWTVITLIKVVFILKDSLFLLA